jgi:hypothetical protein
MVLTYFTYRLLSWSELIQRYESITRAEFQGTDNEDDDQVNKQIHILYYIQLHTKN